MAQYGLMDRNYRLNVHLFVIGFFFKMMLIYVIFLPNGVSPLSSLSFPIRSWLKKSNKRWDVNLTHAVKENAFERIL